MTPANLHNPANAAITMEVIARAVERVCFDIDEDDYPTNEHIQSPGRDWRKAMSIFVYSADIVGYDYDQIAAFTGLAYGQVYEMHHRLRINHSYSPTGTTPGVSRDVIKAARKMAKVKKTISDRLTDSSWRDPIQADIAAGLYRVVDIERMNIGSASTIRKYVLGNTITSFVRSNVDAIQKAAATLREKAKTKGAAR
jgi:hypothetical protein